MKSSIDMRSFNGTYYKHNMLYVIEAHYNSGWKLCREEGVKSIHTTKNVASRMLKVALAAHLKHSPTLWSAKDFRIAVFKRVGYHG